MNLFNKTITRYLSVVILLALLIFLPFFLKDFYTSLASEILILALWGLSWNLLYGYTGMLSFGHAGFYALGAYITGLLINRIVAFPLAPLLALLAGGVITALLAVVIGYVVTRSTGTYFALLNLAVSMVVYSVLLQWRELTGGSDGFMVSYNLKLLGVDLINTTAQYYWVMAIVVICAGIIWIITRSHFGHVLKSIRENRERVKFLGLPVRRYSLYCYVIACFFGGIAGGLHAYYTGYLAPGISTWSKSAEPLLVSLIGGPSYFAGPVIGSVIFLFVKDFIMSLTEYWKLGVGAIFVFIVLFARGGVLGVLAQLVRKYTQSSTVQGSSESSEVGE